MTLTLEAWERRLRDVPRIIQPLAVEVVEWAGRKGVGIAQGLVIVKSHRLQHSISIDSVKSEPTRATVEYSAKTPYALLVEKGFGTHAGFGPRPYMMPSAMLVKPQMKRRAGVIGVEALKRSLT